MTKETDYLKKNGWKDLIEVVEKKKMFRCENCQTDFNTYDEFEEHFKYNTGSECNILLEESRLIEEESK